MRTRTCEQGRLGSVTFFQWQKIGVTRSEKKTLEEGHGEGNFSPRAECKHCQSRAGIDLLVPSWRVSYHGAGKLGVNKRVKGLLGYGWKIVSLIMLIAQGRRQHHTWTRCCMNEAIRWWEKDTPLFSSPLFPEVIFIYVHCIPVRQVTKFYLWWPL